ncbi:STAS domain-containing protein [Meiothermus cerbereus]|jgi:anti-anti-sigma factor|uniref:STAS domain-containing protein n=1 Tax=Meiothermus cerbereus TaxID=65552 RepID=UPI0006869B1F|nr:STAS domain-containing protein [Meiothermus cerbereus]
MHVERHDLDGQTIYALQGRFDAHQVPLLKSRLELGSRTVLDMAGVNFVDSSGLALLVNLFKRSREEGKTLLIRNLQDPVRLILEITGLLEILPIEA